jgi:membrane associated rhomboid family serine protease
VITSVLILVNVAIYILQTQTGDELVATYALWPLGRYFAPEVGRHVGFHWWQLFTSAFLHGSVMHLFLNMFALRMFGRAVERRLGTSRYVALYVASVLTAAVVQLVVVSSGDGPPYPTIGASGGVFGILLAVGVLFPRQRVMLLIPPIPMPAWLFVTLYGLLELGSGVLGTQTGVAHFAHLGGMLGAGIVLAFSRRRRS